MFAEGWIKEVEQLLSAHDPPWGSSASQSIGYQRIAKALREETDPVYGSGQDPGDESIFGAVPIGLVEEIACRMVCTR